MPDSRSEPDASCQSATVDDVPDPHGRVEVALDPEQAIRNAVKACIDAGDDDRAAHLMQFLKAFPKPAVVVDLAAKRRERSGRE